MASVYLATDEKLGRSVAIKILHAHMENNPELRQRFNHEAQAISGLDHPNIVKIYDFSGVESSKLWFVTEIIKGANLADVLAKSKGKIIHPIIAACIVRESCKALSHAHSFGIVHRDIKPENIMITYDGILKLMDFGIAKIQQRGAVTVTGTFMGSPSYMSPEQVRGRNIDHRCDLYSLSVLFYELVTGRLPFMGNSTHDVIVKIMEGQFTPPIIFCTKLSETLNQLICSGLSRNPDARPSSALEMEKFIQSFLLAQNFDESHVELQRYFKNPEVYEEKFLTPKFNQQHSPESVRNHNESAISRPHTKNQPRPEQGTFVLAQHEAFLRQSKVNPQNPLKIVEQMAERGLRRDRMIPPLAVPIPQKRISAYSAARPAHAPAPIIFNIGHAQLPQNPKNLPQRAAHPRYTFPRVPKRIRPKKVEVYAINPPRSSILGFIVFLIFMGILAGILFEIFRSMPDTKFDIKNRTWPKHEKKIPVSHEPRIPEHKITKAKEEPAEVEELPKPEVTKPLEKPLHSSSPKVKIFEPKTTATPEKKVEKKPEVKKPDVKEKVLEPKKAIEPKIDGFFGVSSQPASEIYWHGKKIGTTVDTGLGSGWIKFPSGAHKIELMRSGYETRSLDIMIKPQGRLVIPQVTLTQSAKQKFNLTISTNKIPVTISISAANKKERISSTTNQRTFSLDAGSYDVTVEHHGDKQTRNINLSGQNTQVTFNVNFKDSPAKGESP